jgi:hypothetical protein
MGPSTKVWFQLSNSKVPDKKIFMWISHRVHVKLSSAVGAILVKGPNRRTYFWKRTIQWLFHQNFVLIILRDFLWTLNFCRFWPIMHIRKKGGVNLNQTLLKWSLGGPLPKLCPAFQNFVGAILVKGPNRRTYFWKRTIQWLFHQNFVLIEQMVSEKKIFMGISHRVSSSKIVSGGPALWPRWLHSCT